MELMGHLVNEATSRCFYGQVQGNVYDRKKEMSRKIIGRLGDGEMVGDLHGRGLSGVEGCGGVRGLEWSFGDRNIFI